MKAVVDTSPLIFLCKLDALNLLPRPCGTTPAVLDEVRAGAEHGHPEAVSIERLLVEGSLILDEPKGASALPLPLGPGESSVIRLAHERGIGEVVLDDRTAIRVAKVLGLQPVSTAFLLLRARRAGTFTREGYRERLDRLAGHGYFLSAPLYQRLLEAGR